VLLLLLLPLLPLPLPLLLLPASCFLQQLLLLLSSSNSGKPAWASRRADSKGARIRCGICRDMSANVGLRRGRVALPFVGPALVDSARGRENRFSANAAAGVVGLAAAEYVRTEGARETVSLVRGVLATDFAAGCIAGVSSIAATYPVGKLVTRQQVDGHGAWQAARHMWLEGPSTLYRGAQPLLVQRGLQLGIMFGMYAKLYDQLACSTLARTLQPSDGTIRFAAGVLAGGTDALALTPLERVQTLMQLRQSRHCSLAGAGSIRGVTLSLARHGPRELYRGVGTAVLRNGACTGCYFTLLPHARETFSAARSFATEYRWKLVLPVLQSSRCEDFVCGVGLGCGMSVFVFPMSTIMKWQQTRTSGRHVSMLEALKCISMGRGTLAVYRGLPAFMVKSAAAW
jgi:hypothetical protein